MKYVSLTLNDLILGLSDLVEVRLPAATSSATVGLYAPRLTARLAEIRALPTATTGGEPFAEELAAKDLEHDGHGGAIWHLTEAILRSPTASTELKETFAEVRARFIPELAELKRPHADEAAAAVQRAPDLEAMAKTLRAQRLPGGVTLYDWVSAFLSAGRDLDGLLKDRANVVNVSRSGAGALRASTLGQLNRFRAALADEFEEDAEAAASLDRALFSYLDGLEKRRVLALAPVVTEGEAKKPADPEKPADPAKPG